jgi:hypothetical protein
MSEQSTLATIAAIAGIGGSIAAVAALYYSRSSALDSRRGRVGQDLIDNPAYRAEIASTFSQSPAAAYYRRSLSSSLDWSNRVFGPPGQPYALAWSLWLALIYSWSLFWGLCAAGSRCRMLSVPMLEESATTADAQIAALMLTVGLGVMGLGFYWVGKCIGQWERGRAQRRLRRKQRLWPRRLLLALAFGGPMLALAFGPAGETGTKWAGIVSILAMLGVGGILGAQVSYFVRNPWLAAGIAGAGALAGAATLAGAITLAGTIALAGAMALAGVGALTLAGVIAGALTLAGGIAGAGAVAEAQALAEAGPAPGAVALVAALGIAGAGAGVSTLGFLYSGLHRS